MQILIENERDKKILSWLQKEFDEKTIKNAVSLLVGKRKPYVSNVCKILKVEPPEHIFWLNKEEVRAKSAEIKAKFMRK